MIKPILKKLWAIQHHGLVALIPTPMRPTVTLDMPVSCEPMSEITAEELRQSLRHVWFVDRGYDSFGNVRPRLTASHPEEMPELKNWQCPACGNVMQAMSNKPYNDQCRNCYGRFVVPIKHGIGTTLSRLPNVMLIRFNNLEIIKNLRGD